MPEQTYPPYVSGALTVPRQLNRWLDINPQNGFLSRTSTVITLPVFTTENSWNGYSNIVSSFNIESPNAISLKPFTAPSDPNYVLCVSYRIGNVVTRYMIWDATGSVMSQTIPFYVGQPLKKNFRFEVWNTSQGAVSQATEFKFYTSKLGSIDYRFGADYALATDGGQITAFTVSTSASSVALPTTNLFNRWKASTGISNTNWNSNYGTSNLFVGGNLGAITTAVDSSIQNNTVITNGETLLVTNTSLSPSALCVMYAVVKSLANDTGDLFGISTSNALFGGNNVGIVSKVGSALNVDGNALNGALTNGVWSLVAVFFDYTNHVSGGYVIPISGNMIEPAFSLPADATVAQPNAFTVGRNAIGFPTVSFKIAELLVYHISVLPTLRNSIISYVQNNYGSLPFAVPMQFPTTSVSTTN